MSGQTDRVTEAQVRRELGRTLRRDGRRRARIGALIALALAAVAGVLAAKFLFRMADIRTNAMGDTLRAGDIVLCDRLDSPLSAGRKPARGALVLIRYSENGIDRETIRRIVALPGDEISVDSNGRVILNGAALDETYAWYRAESDGPDVLPGGALQNPFVSPEEAARLYAQAAAAAKPEGIDDGKYPLTVPGGRLFVLCDNRENLMDSRSSDFGLVDEGAVTGWPRMVLWPAYRVGAQMGGRK